MKETKGGRNEGRMKERKRGKKEGRKEEGGEWRD